MSTVYRNLFAMGTRFDMVIPGIEEDYGDFIFSLTSKEIRRLDELLSNYNEYSTLSKLNKTAWPSAFYGDEEMFDLISGLKEMYSASLGFFDVSIGAFKNKFNDSFVSSMDFIHLNNKEKSIQFAKPGISIDSGGFGKGYALENIKKLLSDHDIYQAFISFGESSVIVLGNHPYGDSWKVSIPDIYSAESVYEFQLKNNALSVSGNTPANSDKYPEGHIINTATGKKEVKPGIVCVTGSSAFHTEILSTALFATGEQEQKQIMKNFPGYKAVSILYSQDRIPKVQEIEVS